MFTVGRVEYCYILNLVYVHLSFPQTAKVIWRLVHGLMSKLTVWGSRTKLGLFHATYQ